MSYLRQLSQW